MLPSAVSGILLSKTLSSCNLPQGDFHLQLPCSVSHLLSPTATTALVLSGSQPAPAGARLPRQSQAEGPGDRAAIFSCTACRLFLPFGAAGRALGTRHAGAPAYVDCPRPARYVTEGSPDEKRCVLYLSTFARLSCDSCHFTMGGVFR